jgi:poly(hydroxyalkanoate) depolymerase family esterase
MTVRFRGKPLRHALRARHFLMLGAALVVIAPAAARATSPARTPAPDCGCGNVATYTYSGPTSAVTGKQTYLVFTPNGYTGRKALPLVVVTHGCETTAAQQEAANNYDQLAERFGFIILYPDDNDLVHPIQCWQFYNPLNQIPGEGDAASVAAMTRDVIAHYRVNTQRVYEIGMSSGALITSDLAADYPELYAVVGIMAGGPFGNDACLSGQDPSAAGFNPQLQASIQGAYHAEGANKRVVPVIVLNGTDDHTVNPVCDQMAIEQWLETDNLVSDGTTTLPLRITPAKVTHGQVRHGYAYSVESYTQPSGCLIAQHWVINGMGHFWSGGTTNPAYKAFTDPKGPSASAASWAFFQRFTRSSTSHRCADLSASHHA